jgi:trehalose 6-phosphate phosphatase
MTEEDEDLLERFRRSHPTGVFLDFDGTLSEIVLRPDQARAALGARVILAGLVSRHELVAVVSGRPADAVRGLIEVPGMEVFGHYGIEGAGLGMGHDDEVRTELFRAAAAVPGAWVEDKGASIAVHYRAAPNSSQAEQRLRPALQAIADERGLLVLPGKMVLELAPADTPGKGAVVRREAQARSLRGCLYAGDDRADVEAFATLDELGADGMVTVKVAVRSEETPEELVARADRVVERPQGLLELLARL